MTTPVNPADPEYFPEVFPREEFPRYEWTERPPDLPDDVWISETTHRDGQQGGLPLDTATGIEIYDLLCDLTGTSGAIRQAEFFPYRRSDREALEYAIDRHKNGAPLEPTTWIRGRREDVLLVKDLDITETGLLSSTSDYHTYHKFADGDRASAAAKYLEAVEITLSHGIRPRVHFEDTTRSDPDFVRWMTEQVLIRAEGYPAAQAPRFRICDTLGIGLPYEDVALPRSIPRWIRLMRATGLSAQQIEIHPHNDTGLALANCLAAIRAGCGVISGCCLGVGERTGNAPVEAAIVHLLGMGYWDTRRIDLKQVNRLAELYTGLGVGPGAKYPLFGKDAFVTRAGIHADGLNKFWWMYTPFNAPDLLGRPLEVALTKDSGQAGVIFLLRQHLGLECAKDDQGVLAVNGWLNEQFDNGRVSPVEWEELLPVVAGAFPEVKL